MFPNTPRNLTDGFRWKCAGRVAGITVVLAIFLGSMAGGESDKEPDELTSLRQKYFERLEQVKKPITQSYLSALGRLQDSLNQSGDVDGALKVLKLRNEMAKRLASPDADGVSISSTNSAETRATEEEVEEGESYDLTDSRWTWEEPATEIRFFGDGKAVVFYPENAGGKMPHIWKRLGPRRFLVYNTERIGPPYYFKILKNGTSGICSQEGHTHAQGEVSRLPELGNQ